MIDSTDSTIMPSRSSEADFDEILFNRPVSNLSRRKIGILACRHASLRSISATYSVLIALGHNVLLVADIVHQNNQLPADVWLTSNNKRNYQNSDVAIEALMDCNVIINLVEGELNSTMELFTARLFESYGGVYVSDYPKIFKNHSYEGKKIIFSSLQKIADAKHITTKLAGITQVSKLLSQVSGELSASIVATNHNQLIALESSSAGTACIVNAKNNISIVDFMAIFVGLLADSSDTKAELWLKYCQAAGFLYRNHYSESKNGVAELKKYLNEKF